MRAVLCTALGGTENLVLNEVPEPQPKEGQLKVRIRAAGMNYADYLVIDGSYQVKQEVPFIPGGEIAGEIVELGAGVLGWRKGDRITAQIEGGGYAEYAAIHAQRAFALPAGIEFQQAAASFIALGTAYGALRWRARIQEGETCVVLGGAGAVGLAAISVAKSFGARVIGAASSQERCTLMRAQGADEVIEYRTAPLRESVLSLTGSKGADVIIDPVGGEAGQLALRCVNWCGRIVTLGFPAGKPPQYPANILMVKNVDAIGFYFGSYVLNRPAVVAEAFSDIWARMETGRLKPLPQTVGRLDDVANLLRGLRERRQIGKVVVVP